MILAHGNLYALRTVPTIVTVHTFCASRDTRFPMGGDCRDIFARFETLRRKQNLASASGIQRENWGVTMHFSG